MNVNTGRETLALDSGLPVARLVIVVRLLLSADREIVIRFPRFSLLGFEFRFRFRLWFVGFWGFALHFSSQFTSPNAFLGPR